jgi:hypothetical protein
LTSDTELALERLVTLMDEQGVDGITTWQAERKQATDDRAARVRENSYYFAGLMGETQVLDMNNDVVTVYRVVETYPIAADDLPEFARLHGLDTEALRDVLEHRRLEISAKGKTWRSAKPGYVDRSVFYEDRQKDMEADAKEQVKTAMRNEAIKTVPRSLPMFPTTKNWRSQ